MSASRFLCIALVLLLPAPSLAFLLSDASDGEAGQVLTVDRESVEVRFLSASASMENEFIFDANAPDGNFSCAAAKAGDRFGVGAFDRPTQIDFFLRTPNDALWTTGPGELNDDGVAHAKLEQTGPHSVRLGFEDVTGGGDFDYNDCAVEILIEPLP